MKQKIPYPIIIIKAVDWTIYEDYCSVMNTVTDSQTTKGWICGFLIGSSEKNIIIGWEIFENEKELPTVRRRITIPKSNILYKKIIRVK